MPGHPLSEQWLSALVGYENDYSCRTPHLARGMLTLGVAATIGTNVAYGLPHSQVGAAISAWPAVALVGAVEMMMLQVRSARDEERPPTLISVAADALEAATLAYRASVVAANPLSQRRMMERFGLTRTQATKVRQVVNAESNGHRVPTEPASSRN